MSESEFDYGIHSDFPARPETPNTIGAKFLQTLDALSVIDPTVFANWQIIDFQEDAALSLEAARSHIASVIEHNARRDDLRARPEWGYTGSAIIESSTQSRNISLRISTGGSKKGEIWLRTGGFLFDVPPDPAMLTFPTFNGAMLAISAIWRPLWACVYAFKLSYNDAPLFPGAALFPYSRFHIPWLAYLSAPLAVGLKLHSDIRTARTPDGGLSMAATQERLDPTNREHLRRARILAETLIACTGEKSS